MARSEKPSRLLRLPSEIRLKILQFVAGPCLPAPNLGAIDELKELYVQFGRSEELRRQWHELHELVKGCERVRSFHEAHRLMPKARYIRHIGECLCNHTPTAVYKLARRLQEQAGIQYYEDPNFAIEADLFEAERERLRAWVGVAEFAAYVNVLMMCRVNHAIAVEMEWVKRKWLSGLATSIDWPKTSTANTVGHPCVDLSVSTVTFDGVVAVMRLSRERTGSARRQRYFDENSRIRWVQGSTLWSARSSMSGVLLEERTMPVTKVDQEETMKATLTRRTR